MYRIGKRGLREMVGDTLERSMYLLRGGGRVKWLCMHDTKESRYMSNGLIIY